MTEAVQVLDIRLHDTRVGYLAGDQGGRNAFTFAPEYVAMGPARPTLGLAFNRLLAEGPPPPQRSRHRLPSWFSNLLPEGALRDLVASRLKVHSDNEFPILAALGADLPGAVSAAPLSGQEIPDIALQGFDREALADPPTESAEGKGFSLAGVQMKFSMKRHGRRYTLLHPQEPGDWIVKTPSVSHPFVPVNEFSVMRLAEAAGIPIPEIELVPLEQLEGLPALSLPPDEQWAYAIRRFDRAGGGKIHMEDLAQVMNVRANDKYGRTNYETLGRILDAELLNPAQGLRDYVQRLMANILLANGDAHLKNWSLLYPDRRTPILAPAYDLLFTQVYVEGEDGLALNLAKNKHYYDFSLDHWRRFAEKTGLDEKQVLGAVREVVDNARATWPHLLETLPMVPEHKERLIEHWARLRPEFRI